MLLHQSPPLHHHTNNRHGLIHRHRIHRRSITSLFTPTPSRRSVLLLSTTLPLTTPPPPSPSPSPSSSPSSSPPPPPSPDTTITDRFFLDFSICPTYFRQAQTQIQAQAQSSAPPCPDSEPMGRVILGLYGKLVPVTVSNFKTMCKPNGPSYKNSAVHKVLPGQYMVAGRQGKRSEIVGDGPDGERASKGLARNVEAVDPRAFVLGHDRAGVVSLCLGLNDDDEEVKLDPGYRNVEFLITTGPGPCPELDGKNIVFGTVVEGLDVIRAIAAVPTFEPGERIRQFNELAELIGDERAQMGRAMWNRPLKTVYISDCGELMVAKPTLSPSLP